MPKGQYDRSKVMSKGQTAWNKGVSAWSDAQDDYLQELCKTTMSYSQCRVKFNERFPHDTKTRNALLGRATRKGYRGGKPKPPTYGHTNAMQATRKANIGRKRKLTAEVKRGLAPVVFKQEQDSSLRHEGDKGQYQSEAGRKLGYFDPVVVERKKGNLPSIIEQAPLTSAPLAECERGTCMWPTSEDISCLEVCGVKATIGAYCARHAQVAFRILPTNKRNRTRDKEDREYAKRIDGSHHRGDLDPDGAWLNAQLMALDEVTIDDEPEGEHPLFIPHFLDEVLK